MNVCLFLSLYHRQRAQGLGQSAAGGGFAFRHCFGLRFGGAVHPPP